MHAGLNGLGQSALAPKQACVHTTTKMRIPSRKDYQNGALPEKRRDYICSLVWKAAPQLQWHRRLCLPAECCSISTKCCEKILHCLQDLHFLYLARDELPEMLREKRRYTSHWKRQTHELRHYPTVSTVISRPVDDFKLEPFEGELSEARHVENKRRRFSSITSPTSTHVRSIEPPRPDKSRSN